MSKRLISALVWFTGLSYLATGAALLLAPTWFYQYIGHFPPFNRHYIGDLGAFTLPLGAGLLLAARDPFRHRLLLGVAAGVSLLHGVNHAYDAVIGRESLLHWLTDAGPIFVGGLLLLLVFTQLRAPKGAVDHGHV